MTLEQLGFVEEINGNRVFYSREKMFGGFLEYIEFHLTYKEIDITSIDTIDMMLLEAIYAKAKELFE